MDNIRRTRWVRTLGGPFIAVPQSVVELWSGSRGLRGVLDDEADEEDTDYWRAVSAPAPVGVIEVAGRPAMVLAIGRVPTAYLHEHRLFVHEEAYTDCADAAKGALRLLPSLQWHSAGTLPVHEALWMFDATFLGLDVMEGERAEIDLLPGIYELEWSYHLAESPDDVTVTLIRLNDPRPL